MSTNTTIMKNYRIGILGMGGVGGYLGAKLAGAKLAGVEIVFIARNQTKEVLEQQGLKLITDSGEQIAHAQLVSDNPSEIGPLDLLICTVKGYDLDSSLKTYQECLGKGSVVLPFLNGVDIARKVKAVLAETEVWEGCIYIVARQIERGVIRQTGTLIQLYFGSEGTSQPTQEGLEQLETIFTQAGIKATLSADIEVALWKKFFFISVMATFTSYYNSPIKIAQEDPEKAAEIREMLNEVSQVAEAMGIVLPTDLAKSTYDRILALPPETTSSMYADFQKSGPTELEQLTGDVIRLGEQHGVTVPLYKKMYAGLLR